MIADRLRALARRELQIETEAILALVPTLDERFILHDILRAKIV